MERKEMERKKMRKKRKERKAEKKRQPQGAYCAPPAASRFGVGENFPVYDDNKT